MLSNDANFRLDSVLRSSIDKDPWLGYGYSYFVEDEPYNSWVLGHAAEEEVSIRCSTSYLVINTVLDNDVCRICGYPKSEYHAYEGSTFDRCRSRGMRTRLMETQRYR
jgi:hypothetical protein